jgi:hypothetical protein
MMERRYTSLLDNEEDNKKFSIEPTSLNLDPEFCETFLQSNNKLDLAFRLLSENDENLQKFGIRQIRNFSDTLKKGMKVEDLIKPNNFDKIIDFMMNSRDNKIIFESSWAIINITNHSTYYSKSLAKSQYIMEIFKLLNCLQDFILKNHIIWVFSNLIGDNEENSEIICSQVDLMSYVINNLKAENTLPSYFKSNLFWLLGNLIKYRKIEYVHASHGIYPIVFKYLKSNIDKNIFMEALFATEKLSCLYMDENFELMKEHHVAVMLIPYISTKSPKFELKIILRILADLTWKDEYNIKAMYEEDIFDHFENYLSETLVLSESRPDYISKQTDVLKDFILCIGNFASTVIEKIKDDLIRKTKIPKYLVNLLKYSSSNQVIREIICSFNNALDTKISNIKMELLRINIPELFCQYLSISDVEIQRICLQGILNFLLYADDIMKQQNILKIQLETIGAVTEIDNLQQSNDDEVAKISFNIMTKYFPNH